VPAPWCSSQASARRGLAASGPAAKLAALLRHILFNGGSGPDTKIVQKIGDVSAREIASAVAFGAWSPDGKQIVFERQVEDKASIFVKPVAGGTEKLILSRIATTALSPD
jgi:hypothetical protein